MFVTPGAPDGTQASAADRDGDRRAGRRRAPTPATKEASVASVTEHPPVEDRERRYGRLRRFNVVVGLFHLVQGVVLLVLANDLALPVLATFLDDDPVAQEGPGTPELVFELPIAVLVAVFVLFAAADHLLVASPRVVDWYERKLDERSNYARWIEYSISSSIMIVLIAAFVGIWDLAAVVAIFAVNTSMILFGLLMERHERPETADWSAFWFGTFAGIVPWGILGYYLVATGAAVPTFVYVIYFFQLVLFWSFAVNMALQYAQIGRWRDYVFGEYAYIVLSLAAKTLLAWLIFGNVLRS
jgi:hypothetical protein